jgi:hypothetical protein
MGVENGGALALTEGDLGRMISILTVVFTETDHWDTVLLGQRSNRRAEGVAHFPTRTGEGLG